MLFTSYRFIIFILALFIIYYLIPKKLQWMLLLGASYLFYAFAGLNFLAYIAFTTITVYGVSLKIGKLHEIQSEYLAECKGQLSRDEKKAYKHSIKSIQWKWLLLCLFLNFGVLAVVKYTNFAIANINTISGAFGSGPLLSFWDIALPLGISFYTFQTMGYIIDVYRGKYPPEKNLFKLALFVSFFPQLIQGPISRFDDLSQSLFEEHSYSRKNISFGFQRILWGYFKKMVIADRILIAVTTIIGDPSTYQGIFVLVGMLFYTVQLYADFTGGIDITIGVAEVLGIKVKENFDRPYSSKSIKEFWRRWHITMGTWFKDYLFYPISVCRPMLNLSKTSRRVLGDKLGKRVPVYLATMTVWFTTGIWHGSSWNFIVWGLLNGVVILISQECEPLYEKFHHRFKVKDKAAFQLFQIVRTTLLMSSLRLFDIYRDVPLTFQMFGTMFTNFNIYELFNGSLLDIGLTTADYFVILISLICSTIVSTIHRDASVRELLSAKPQVLRYAVYYTLILTILVMGAYGAGYDSAQFIYNQF